MLFLGARTLKENFFSDILEQVGEEESKQKKKDKKHRSKSLIRAQNKSGEIGSDKAILSHTNSHRWLDKAEQEDKDGLAADVAAAVAEVEQSKSVVSSEYDEDDLFDPEMEQELQKSAQQLFLSKKIVEENEKILLDAHVKRIKTLRSTLLKRTRRCCSTSSK